MGRPASETLGPLKVIASGPDVRTVFERMRDVIADQRSKRAMTDAEAAGAHWATDTLEALARADAKKRLKDCGLLTAEEVSDALLSGVRGG